MQIICTQLYGIKYCYLKLINNTLKLPSVRVRWVLLILIAWDHVTLIYTNTIDEIGPGINVTEGTLHTLQIFITEASDPV